MDKYKFTKLNIYPDPKEMQLYTFNNSNNIFMKNKNNKDTN